MDWKVFVKKVNMMIEELEQFNNIYKNLVNIETLHYKNVSHQMSAKAEIQKVKESPASTYGLIKAVTKDQKLSELADKENKYLVEVGLGNELVALIHKIFIEIEIPLLKSIKKTRFNKIVSDFSQSRIQELEKELMIWKTLNTPNEIENDDKEEKIERRDYRFTDIHMGKHG